MLRVILVCITVIFSHSLSANAQITFDGCRDIRGVPVASEVNYRIRDVAIAGLGPRGEPVIYYNPRVLSSFAPQTRLFWYAHECGHHARGHNFGTTHPLRVEQDADCFGIRALVNARQINDGDLRIIQRDLEGLGPGDWTHLPGRQRAINLSACLGGRNRTEPRPRQLLGGICESLAGLCRLGRPLPLRSPCFCPTRFGPAQGQVR